MEKSLRFKHGDLTKEIIGSFYDVYNALGYGFLEKVYENALRIVLSEKGLAVEQQKPIHVYFQGQIIGEYFADLVVNNCVILELKAAKSLDKTHEAQLLNYLKATPYEVGLLFNFGLTASYKRKAFDNNKKPNLQRTNPINPDNPVNLRSIS